MTAPDLSIVIPVRDEADSVIELDRRLRETLDELGIVAEVIWVDDGSDDGTGDRIRALPEASHTRTVIVFERSYGQTTAIQAGIDGAHGEWIALLDGDLQNPPEELAKLWAARGGADLVQGRRWPRRDRFWSRRLPSAIWNGILRLTWKVPLHDIGCTMRIVRRERVEGIRLYGEMHRFLPLLVHTDGGTVAEIPVAHSPRRSGRSKYGFGRSIRALLDLFAIRFLVSYFHRPILAFGSWGLMLLASGGLCGAILVWMKLARGVDMTGNPFIFGAFFGIFLGVQCLILGLIGEVLLRLYYEGKGLPAYRIRRIERTPARDAAPERYEGESA